MAFSRRKTLALLGGGTILAATAGAGAFVTTRTPTRALEPWARAGGYEDPRRRALSYAILAPNPHNRQPWQVDLRQPDQVILYRDKEKDLPETDPYARQLTIGLGCFLEQMTIAAGETGHAVSLDLFPEGEDGPVAIATFAAGGKKDPLFAHVLERRSCKEPFDMRGIPNGPAKSIAPLAALVSDAETVGEIRDMTWEAFKIEMYTPRTLKESVDLMRIGKAEINENPDGIDLGGPFLETMNLLGIVTREEQLDPASSGFKEGLRIYEEMLMATPAYAVITTPGNSRADQIEAGRRWLRLNLTTTAHGLALQPVSQLLQEYPEMAELYARTHKMLAEPGHTVQMLGRVGFGPEIGPSPRWPLETRILNG